MMGFKKSSSLIYDFQFGRSVIESKTAKVTDFYCHCEVDALRNYAHPSKSCTSGLEFPIYNQHNVYTKYLHKELKAEHYTLYKVRLGSI